MASKKDIPAKEQKKTAVRAKAAKIDPFASTVEAAEPAPEKATTKKVAVATTARAPRRTKTVKAASAASTVDPFDKIITAGSPAAKPTRKAAEKTGSHAAKETKKATGDMTAVIAAEEPKVELSPAFKALADVRLPELKRENRARLQMQTPTRLYFYWSVKENPWALLKNVFGETLGNYSLVVKLIDRTLGTEKIERCEGEGEYWFDVEPNRTYAAEVGFYATGRPYFRVLQSNIVETPRRSPSPRAASESPWTVSAGKFAEVLDVAGFAHDAFDVAMTGDDAGLAKNASELAFEGFLGRTVTGLTDISPDEIRYALVALASGATLDELRGRISPALFAILQANADKMDAKRAMGSLTEHFDVEGEELIEEEFGPGVFGASLINFPRTLKTKQASTTVPPRYNPVSSFSLR